MITQTNDRRVAPNAHSAAKRGYTMAYREEEVNHCPSCSRSHWYIGRLLAECGFCGTAIPLKVAHIQAAGGHTRNRKLYIPSTFAA